MMRTQRESALKAISILALLLALVGTALSANAGTSSPEPAPIASGTT